MANLLFVDDNLEATRPMAMLFRFFSHQVDCVGSGNEALTYLEQKLPDVVVLDVMMPGMDGMEVLRQIRNNPRTARLAVVMYSAVSDPAYRDSALTKGADDYLVKGSIEVDELRVRIEHAANSCHVPSPAAMDASGTETSFKHVN
jgi:CheY-like chemotaxis protein